MRLTANWRAVMRHAWSVRLILLALLLDVVAAALPFVEVPVHPAIPSILGALATGGAFLARFVAQKRLSAPDTTSIPWETGETHEDQH